MAQHSSAKLNHAGCAYLHHDDINDDVPIPDANHLMRRSAPPSDEDALFGIPAREREANKYCWAVNTLRLFQTKKSRPSESRD